MRKKTKPDLYEIIFETDTVPGRVFDLGIIFLILLSIIAVMLESVSEFNQQYGKLIKYAEWVITIMFTLEYLIRIRIVDKSWSYIFSFYGIIDFLSIIPTYIGIFITGTQSLLVIRVLRLLRIFRILKITRYLDEGKILLIALKSSRIKIGVFLFTVLTLVIIIGTLMYLIEGEKHGFTSIPKSIYWAIVTLTTVGYGDITPQTPLGQFLSGLVMIMGYGIIAVPTGIVSVELANTMNKGVTSTVCHNCLKEGHDLDAEYCKFCGATLNNSTDDDSSKK